jgi:hypothetical protein
VGYFPGIGPGECGVRKVHADVQQQQQQQQLESEARRRVAMPFFGLLLTVHSKNTGEKSFTITGEYLLSQCCSTSP